MSPQQWFRMICLSTVLAVSLVACGDDDNGNNGRQRPTVNVNGTWDGTWQSTVRAGGGTITATLAQQGGQLTGRATITNSPCWQHGTLVGSVEADMFEARFRAPNRVRVDFAGDVSANERGIRGTYSVVRGGACTGDVGTFQVQRQ
jgi:hypothetical protein